MHTYSVAVQIQLLLVTYREGPPRPDLNQQCMHVWCAAMHHSSGLPGSYTSTCVATCVCVCVCVCVMCPSPPASSRFSHYSQATSPPNSTSTTCRWTPCELACSTHLAGSCFISALIYLYLIRDNRVTSHHTLALVV